MKKNKKKQKYKEEMNIEVFDNLVDYSIRTKLYEVCSNSFFTLGWADNYAKNTIKNIHSSWSLKDLESSSILPYIEKAFSQSKLFTYNIDKIKLIELNLVKSGDVHFIHTHRDQIVALYYVNLDWQDGHYGETIFYDKKNINNIIYTSPYVPGRIILFDGECPHAIRPQSTMASKFRFTLSIFFDKGV